MLIDSTIQKSQVRLFSTTWLVEWLCKVDNLRTHYAEIKGLKSRAETLLSIIWSAA